MRKLLMLLVFCLASNMIFAQESEKPSNKIPMKGEMDQTKWIIVSLDKYRKELSLGLQLQLLGAAGGAISTGYSNKPDEQRVILIASGAIFVAGYFISANAVRHLSQKNLTFTGNGLALRF